MLARFRRLLPLCCTFALLSACENDLLPPGTEPEPVPFPAVAVSRVDLTYAPGRVVQGRTVQLSAQVTGTAPGYAKLADYPLRWTSSDTTVVRVSAQGQLVARRAGRARVAARARDAADSVEVTVLARGYLVAPVTVPGVDTVYAAGMNGAGQVIVNTATAWPRRRAFVWSGGTAVEITPPDGYALVRDINGRGQVAGGVRTADGVLRPAVWEAGRWTVLEGLPEVPAASAGPVAYASAINDAGQVAGTCGMKCAFRWSGGTAARLEVTRDFISVHVAGINGRGDVVGGGFSDIGGVAQALLWSVGATAVQVGSGRPSASATDINDAGQVAIRTGNGGRTGACGRSECGWVREVDGKERFLPGEVSVVSDLDEGGNVSGAVWVPNGQGGADERGVLWERGGPMVDLTLVLADTTWVVTWAVTLDASGRILAMARNTTTGAFNPVILTPQ